MKTEPKDMAVRTKAFALAVARLYSELRGEDGAAQTLGKEFLRSGTGVGAAFRRLSRSRSGEELVSAIHECLVRADETVYWLELLMESGCVPREKAEALLETSRGLVEFFAGLDGASKGG